MMKNFGMDELKYTLGLPVESPLLMKLHMLRVRRYYYYRLVRLWPADRAERQAFFDDRYRP